MHRKAIVFCCDQNYLPFALHAAHRIAALSTDRDFDICIVDGTTPPIPESLAKDGIRACAMETHGVFDNRQRDARRTGRAFFRLGLPLAMQDEYDRILYLDSDIHVQRGAFSDLMNADLGGRPAGAVVDNQQWRNPRLKPTEYKIFELQNAPYFNSGVLLMDVATWIDQDITAKSVDFLLKNWERLPRNDQAVLNCVLHRNWAQISPVWNWQYSVKSRLFEAMVTANIVHFIGPTKPWNADPGRLPPRFATELFAFLDEYLPGHGLTCPPLAGPDLASRWVRNMLILHLWEYKATARLFARFPTELTVLP